MIIKNSDFQLKVILNFLKIFFYSIYIYIFIKTHFLKKTCFLWKKTSPLGKMDSSPGSYPVQPWFGYAGHMLPILINYMVIHHTLTYWGIILLINPVHITYSPTYPSVETGDMRHYWQWQWQYCWEKLLLCSSSCRQICGAPHWYGQLHSSQMPDSSWFIWGH